MASPTYAATLQKAQAGKLNFSDFIAWWANATFGTDKHTLATQVRAILAAATKTEATQDWIKNKYVTVDANDNIGVTSSTVEAYPGQSVIVGASDLGAGAVEAAGGVLSAMSKWFINNLVRLGEIAVGIVIVAVGANAALKGKSQ